VALQLGRATRRKIEEITGMGLDQWEKWTGRVKQVRYTKTRNNWYGVGSMGKMDWESETGEVYKD